MAIPYLATFLLLLNSSFVFFFVIINNAAINIFVHIAFSFKLHPGISAQKGNDLVRVLTVFSSCCVEPDYNWQRLKTKWCNLCTSALYPKRILYRIGTVGTHDVSGLYIPSRTPRDQWEAVSNFGSTRAVALQPFSLPRTQNIQNRSPS